NNGMLKFAIANNQMGIDNNGLKVEKANFFDVVCFGKTAEIFNKYLKKGSHIIVTGKLKQEKWEKEGQKRSKITIWADSINFVNSGKKSKTATHTA
ncbi:MAG: single-stranded DNA-binding protein, partial [Spirochaetota bacterium]